MRLSDRHRLGPRVYVLGARVHEWHLGAAVLVALTGALAFDRIEQRVTALASAAAGVWLVAKDWQALLPSRRDTAAWRLGLHSCPAPLARVERFAPLPRLAALLAVLPGRGYLAPAGTPNIAWRDDLLLEVTPL